MSTRRVADGKLDLPANPSWIEFPRSDGEVSSWPKNIHREVDHEGHVNFMQPQELDSFTALKWRMAVAKAIALDLGMPEGPEYVLKNWPDGYRMYDHHKGPADNPRHDIYLFGARGARRFRSINEFIPHAIWLMRDPTMDCMNCYCKYCTKKPQKDITASMNNILRSTPGTSGPSSSRPKLKHPKPRDVFAKNRERQREQKAYAAVQRVGKPLKAAPSTKTSSHVVTQPMLVERNADLRAVHSKTSMQLRRWFREGEVVWCALHPPIPGPRDVVIQFWPGVIEQTILKTVPVPREGSTSTPQPSVTAPAAHANGEIPRGEVLDNIDAVPVPWTVRQSTMYKAQLLGVSYSYTIDDNQVLPYLAHIPAPELLNALSEFPPESLDLNRGKKRDFDFNPCPGNNPPDFTDAVVPYAMAIQIGSELSRFYSLTDEWDFKYTIPTPVSAPFRPPPTSLQSAIEAAGRHNARASALNSQSVANGASSSDTSQADSQSASGRAAIPRPPPEQQLMQTRFQGLWWGAERIWTDDFIRLKVPRQALAPNGAENIFPPAGPSKAALEYAAASGTDPSEIGAKSRGVFMRLDGLFLVDSHQADGRLKKECRACGPLYELADEDWVEPAEMKDITTNGSDSTSSSHPPQMIGDSSQASASPFMPGPSPLKPPALPNFDPSVPVDSTTSAVLARALPSGQTISTKPNPPSNVPTSSHYLLPQAPLGYRFRPILPPGYESVVSLSLVSGRYYPRILSHPLLKGALQRAAEEGNVSENSNLWALEGLSPGFHNAVDAEFYKRSRVRMLDDADKNAIEELERFKQDAVMLKTKDENAMEEDEPEANQLAYPMDVDG